MHEPPSHLNPLCISPNCNNPCLVNRAGISKRHSSPVPHLFPPSSTAVEQFLSSHSALSSSQHLTLSPLAHGSGAFNSLSAFPRDFHARLVVCKGKSPLDSIALKLQPKGGERDGETGGDAHYTGLGGLRLATNTAPRRAYVIPCLHERLQHRSSSGTAAPCKC